MEKPDGVFDYVRWPLIAGFLWAIVKLLSALALQSLKQAIETLERDVARKQAYIDQLEARLQVRRDNEHRLNGQLQIQQATIDRANEYLFQYAMLLGREPPTLDDDEKEEA